ncbi:hypothetical protein KIN20_025220 [Parelaphostrongylus tenuis]|uniref:Uncharacterized protein n=1 Tax=Parelaphostrongylus tenuis TaxID=148309 RepID=A0AAD5NBQ4_PARTN|nr:hypothetical protein KIN20_025220 [Parelaphostrongylus tenuis]
MKSTKLNGKPQQANLLLNAGFNALMSEILAWKTSRSGRPVKLNNEELTAVLEDGPSSSARELATQHNVSHTTVLAHFHQLRQQ